MNKFNLSEKIFWIDGKKEPSYNSQPRLYVKDVKEFIRLCEDNSEEINGISYIKISKLQKFAGEKLI